MERTFAGGAKFASLLCGEGKLELTEFFSSALYGVGWLVPHCARPTRAFLLSLSVADGTERGEGYDFLSWFSYTTGERSFEETLPKERSS